MWLDILGLRGTAGNRNAQMIGDSKVLTAFVRLVLSLSYMHTYCSSSERAREVLQSQQQNQSRTRSQRQGQEQHEPVAMLGLIPGLVLPPVECDAQTGLPIRAAGMTAAGAGLLWAASTIQGLLSLSVSAALIPLIPLCLSLLKAAGRTRRTGGGR